MAILVNLATGNFNTAVATAKTDLQLLAVPITASTTTGIMSMQIDGYTDQTGTDATVYYDDVAILFPAGHQINLGSLDEWSYGQPITPPIATLLSANDVRSVPISSLNGTTSIGGHVANTIPGKIKTIDGGETPIY